jgi:thiamine-monophosphate kinase
MTTVGELGEQGLLAVIKPYCSALVGDDGAVLSSPQGSIVVTTDVLVDGVHFSDRTTPPHSIGWRAVAANLSDLAAMGARPLGITVGLSLPPETPVDWVEGVYQGMQDCLDRYGGSIIGGDLVRSKVRTLAITAIGEVQSDRAIFRTGANVGDVLVVTGPHGASRAGLEALLNPQNLDLPEVAILIKAHQYPVPRLDLRPYLDSNVVGMDSSDGLADALVQICRASGVGARIDRLPIHPLVQEYWGDRAMEWTLYGGEDFELVLAMPRDQAQGLIDQVSGCAVIGEVTETLSIVWENGREGRSISQTQSFQHFG